MIISSIFPNLELDIISAGSSKLATPVPAMRVHRFPVRTSMASFSQPSGTLSAHPHGHHAQSFKWHSSAKRASYCSIRRFARYSSFLGPSARWEGSAHLMILPLCRFIVAWNARVSSTDLSHTCSNSIYMLYFP